MIFEKEHELVRQLAKEFAENEIKPTAEEVDETGDFPMEIYQKMAKAGFLGIKITSPASPTTFLPSIRISSLPSII